MNEFLAAILVVAALAQPTHIVIPFLASTTKPNELSFEGASCSVSAGGTEMECEVHQVFLTTSAVAPDTCMVTTNQYTRSFSKEANGTWTSATGPDGMCGIVEISTLTDGGTVRWTMEVRKKSTRSDGALACLSLESTETLSWQNVRRPLPCRFAQPGGLGR